MSDETQAVLRRWGSTYYNLFAVGGRAVGYRRRNHVVTFMVSPFTLVIAGPIMVITLPWLARDLLAARRAQERVMAAVIDLDERRR